MTMIFKLAHLSDLHISPERLEEKARCCTQIEERLHELNPNLIAVAGDSFDHSIRMEDPAALLGVRFYKNLSAIASVIAIKGNHSHDRDTIDLMEFVAYEDGRISVSSDPEIFMAPPPEPMFRNTTPSRSSLSAGLSTRAWGQAGALVFTLPYPSQSYLAALHRKNPEDMRQAVSQALRAVIDGYAAIEAPIEIPRILMFHGTVREAMMSKTQHAMGLDIELSLADLERCNFDIVCAGHLHFAQKLGSNVYYPGGMCYTHFGDEGDKGFWFYEIETFPGVRPVVRAQYERIESKPMVIVDVNLGDAFFEAPPVPANADVRVRVTMQEGDRERLQSMNWAEAFPAASEIQVQPQIEKVQSVRCEEVRTAASLRDKVVAWNHHQEEKGDPVPGMSEAVLEKATMLESMSLEALLESARAKFV
jgi:DNA repair protein SbcD/Mre11